MSSPKTSNDSLPANEWVLVPYYNPKTIYLDFTNLHLYTALQHLLPSFLPADILLEICSYFHPKICTFCKVFHEIVSPLFVCTVCNTSCTSKKNVYPCYYLGVDTTKCNTCFIIEYTNSCGCINCMMLDEGYWGSNTSVNEAGRTDDTISFLFWDRKELIGKKRHKKIWKGRKEEKN
ncbi:hypothetical protein BCR33DRAFT_721857 [Rhizoclosmatium globosum]|uniref:Uncharacterized protein n=1 Tax=Rhizoclosmatium globosum TaxID=329046 RepID=A0A1Y2BPG2_9FUNG|nr:hypothetical protein BCR33DRAFT_721857 [Rhizoclosmatium globosum]|eukprot:ORY36628.1 hypothetical protein BCR33DRAFT_721857 [Rhizoclosmatium globosum]